MDNNITIRQGGREEFLVNQGDPAATTVTLIMNAQESSRKYAVTASYEDGVAVIVLDSTQTSNEEVYNYQINENIPGEDPVIFPNDNCCGEDCEFPTITICESLVVS